MRDDSGRLTTPRYAFREAGHSTPNAPERTTP
jgi:hypothetical protein